MSKNYFYIIKNKSTPRGVMFCGVVEYYDPQDCDFLHFHISMGKSGAYYKNILVQALVIFVEMLGCFALRSRVLFRLALLV